MRTLLDANAVCRYLVHDIPGQAEKTAEVIDAGVAELTIEVLAECIYVFTGFYGKPRADVARVLGALLDETWCGREEVARKSLALYGAGKLDFVDCVLLAESIVNDRAVLTFDKKLLRAMKAASRR
jgi:predicted nucleic-acid-binding protein